MGSVIKDLRLTEAGGSATELCTVQEVKDYLQIEGSGYDTTLTMFILAARQRIEKHCGVSLIDRQAVLTVHATGHTFELPYYPVTSIIQIERKDCCGDWEDVTTEEYCTYGNDRVTVKSNYVGLHEVTYTLGQSDNPVFKIAIIVQAGFMFNNRDQSDKLAPEVSALISGEKYYG